MADWKHSGKPVLGVPRKNWRHGRNNENNTE